MIEEINLSSQIDQMKEYIEQREDGVDRSLFTTSVIKMCLRAKDYNIEKAYNCGLRYFERFKHKINIESKDKLMQILSSSILRVGSSKASVKGETIIIFDLSVWNSKEIEEELIPCTIALVLDYLLRDDVFQQTGCFILFDITGLKLKHLSQIRKKLIKKILNAFECTTSIKILNKLFIITSDKFSQMVFLKFLKKCISKELREKMIVLKKNEFHKLFDYIDSNSLSSKYEGRLAEMKFLNLPILINEALDHMPNFQFDCGPTQFYCSSLSDNKEEQDTDNETLNENLSKEIEDNRDSKLNLSELDKQAASTSGLKKKPLKRFHLVIICLAEIL